MTRPAQLRRRVPSYKEKPLKLHLLDRRAKERKCCRFCGRVLARTEKHVPASISLASISTTGYKKPESSSISIICFFWVLFFFITVKPVVPKCHVPKSVPVGKSAELRCVEDEGFPKSQYQWFRNKEEIPDDPKTSPKFFNSTYTLNTQTGTLVSMSVCVCVFGQGQCYRDKGGAAGLMACCPGVEGDILGRQLMV